MSEHYPLTTEESSGESSELAAEKEESMDIMPEKVSPIHEEDDTDSANVRKYLHSEEEVDEESLEAKEGANEGHEGSVIEMSVEPMENVSSSVNSMGDASHEIHDAPNNPALSNDATNTTSSNDSTNIPPTNNAANPTSTISAMESKPSPSSISIDSAPDSTLHPPDDVSPTTPLVTPFIPPLPSLPIHLLSLPPSSYSISPLPSDPLSRYMSLLQHSLLLLSESLLVLFPSLSYLASNSSLYNPIGLTSDLAEFTSSSSHAFFVSLTLLAMFLSPTSAFQIDSGFGSAAVAASASGCICLCRRYNNICYIWNLFLEKPKEGDGALF